MNQANFTYYDKQWKYDNYLAKLWWGTPVGCIGPYLDRNELSNSPFSTGINV